MMNTIDRTLAIHIQADKLKHPKKTFRQIGNDYNIQPSTVSKAVKGYYNRRFNIDLENDIMPLVNAINLTIEEKAEDRSIINDNNDVIINDNTVTTNDDKPEINNPEQSFYVDKDNIIIHNPVELVDGNITAKNTNTIENDKSIISSDNDTKEEDSNNINNIIFKGFDVDKLQELDLIEDLHCGLVDNRHNSIPTNVFVYSNITSTEMFDYASLYDRAKEFIKDNIDFDENGVPSRDMILYATGLQCAIVSVIRACYEYNVNLYVMHYSNTDKTYHKQTVFNKFHDEVKHDKCPDELRGVIGINCNKLYMYNTSVKKFIDDNSSGYIVDKVMYTSPPKKDNHSVFNKICIICKSKEDAMTCYRAMGDSLSDNNNLYTSLLVYRINKTNGNDRYSKIGSRIRRETNW